MGSKTKFPKAVAMEVARELTQALRSLCEPDRFIWAGSLRRGKAEVGDIELVYIPRSELQADPSDLFGKQVETNLVDAQLAQWLQSGVMKKRLKENGSPTWGKENKLAVHVATGLGVDFFAANRRNFWTLLVCRTGSAENNERICNAAIARGLRWNPYQGFEDRLTGELVYVPDSERAVFERVGLKYLEPNQRI